MDLLFCRMLNQTLNYLDHFARFTQKENVEAVERLLSAHKELAKFERAQLGMPPRLVLQAQVPCSHDIHRVAMLRERR